MGHALEKGTVVGDRDDAPAVAVHEALEELEPGEVEIVRRLVEEEDVRVRVDELL